MSDRLHPAKLVNYLGSWGSGAEADGHGRGFGAAGEKREPVNPAFHATLRQKSAEPWLYQGLCSWSPGEWGPIYACGDLDSNGFCAGRGSGDGMEALHVDQPGFTWG